MRQPVADAPEAALILAGFGSSSPLQLTVEAQQLAGQAGRVLGLGVPQRLRALFERMGAEVIELDQLMAGRDFAEAYAAVAQTVLARAQQDPPAMFVTQGSPLFANAISRFLVSEARRLDLPVRILPGVSPIDVIVAELGIDVGRAGLQTISVRAFASRVGVTSRRMPLLLLDVGGVASGGPSSDAFAQLAEALAREYPPDQPITLVNIAGGGITRVTVSLERVAELLPHVDPSSTLFVDVARKAKRDLNGTQPQSAGATEAVT